MSGWKCSFLFAVITAAPGLAQNLDLDQHLRTLQDALTQLSPLHPDFDAAALAAESQMAAMQAQMDFLQAGGPHPTPNPIQDFRGLTGRAGGGYDAGTRALDAHRYDDAIRDFDAVIAARSDRADGALYWKAYSLNRLGRRDEAAAALAQLRRDYPNSRWLNDAQALEVELKQGAGRPVSPDDESNEDLKLLAINGLMRSDPERAIPLLEALLKGNSSPRVKDRALFVLTQNKSARAHQVLLDFAKGAGNPDLQVQAVRYLGMSGGAGAQQDLAGIYNSTADSAVKLEIIRSLMVSKATDPLVNIAKTEKDAGLRAEAVRQLGILHATAQLVQLYASETSPESRIQILRSLMIAGASDKLSDLARNEKDPQVRSEAIRDLVGTRSATPETLAALYSSAGDPKAKREVVNGLSARGDAKTLIELARKETDPAMKRYMVERLSTMRSKEAADYMLELLK